MTYVVVALAILLALSGAGNAWQYHQHTEDSVRFGTTSQLAAEAKAAAGTCSTSVDALAKAGDKRQGELLGALKGIAPRVAKLNEEASVAARAKPDDPRDLCGSLDRYLRAQIKAGKVPK